MGNPLHIGVTRIGQHLKNKLLRSRNRESGRRSRMGIALMVGNERASSNSVEHPVDPCDDQLQRDMKQAMPNGNRA